MSIRCSVGRTALVLAAVAMTACNSDRPVAPNVVAPAKAVATYAISAPVSDDVMGPLSPVAHFIAAALHDQDARVRLRAALMAPGLSMSGLSLSSCSSDEVLKQLFAAGERRGAGKAGALCQMLRTRGGVSLWMAPGRLRGWSPSMMPIVAAIDNPSRRLPPKFKGYLGARRAVELPEDGSINGPILMVLGAETLMPRAARANPTR